MALAIWPSSLPQKLPLRTLERAEDTFIESQREAGPSFRRNRYSVTIRILEPPTGSFVFTGTQRATLIDFFDTTLGGGVHSFTWLDPLPDFGNVIIRMYARPEFYGIVPGSSAASRLYSCSVGFEILNVNDPAAV